MSFSVDLFTIEAIAPHPNADRLDLVSYGYYQAITQKGRFQVGDEAIYIPEGALLPPDLLEKEQMTGYLAGPQKNRVKAIKLRGILSQGILLKASDYDTTDHCNLASRLNITKYEPPVPSTFIGNAKPKGGLLGLLLNYDIENFKKYGRHIPPGSPFSITEKLHGTCLQVAYLANQSDLDDGVAITSKGLGARGIHLQDDREGNLYLRLAYSLGLDKAVRNLCKSFGYRRGILLGEIYGPVQDLNYGLTENTYAAFDLFIEDHLGMCHFVAPEPFRLWCSQHQIPTVPTLLEGLWAEGIADPIVSGLTTIKGATHIREGIVIRVDCNTKFSQYGRLILKHINPDYLLRKDGTEFT